MMVLWAPLSTNALTCTPLICPTHVTPHRHQAATKAIESEMGRVFGCVEFRVWRWPASKYLLSGHGGTREDAERKNTSLLSPIFHETWTGTRVCIIASYVLIQHAEEIYQKRSFVHAQVGGGLRSAGINKNTHETQNRTYF